MCVGLSRASASRNGEQPGHERPLPPQPPYQTTHDKAVGEGERGTAASALPWTSLTSLACL